MMENAIRTIRTLLPQSGSLLSSEVKEAVEAVLKIPIYKELEKELLIKKIEELYKIRQDEFRIIEKEERKLPWLKEKRSQINFKDGFWGRYQTYLSDEKNFPPDTINKLDRLTDRILDSLFDPTQNVIIDKKGLVVGQVQSGKTANYTGLICKAADAGFKLIIVLAGIHNNLRSQTQLRIDEGFLGFDTQHARAFRQDNIHIGVGRLGQPLVAHSLTSSLDRGDFTKAAANALGLNFATNEPIIAVVKKNVGVLKRIYQWLAAQAEKHGSEGKIINNKSLLLIDDEADNASINISNDPEERSRINNSITKIISLFGRNGYVGYTATPFANIFIPLDDFDLFPRDFIINIPAPSNYIGPEKVFGFEPQEEYENPEAVLPVVNRIDDYKEFFPDRHKKDDPLPTSLPESLKKAIRCFIITCAIRRLRGHLNAHNSMLVHVSRLIRWQDHITRLVEDQFDFYRRGIDQNDSGIFNLFKLDFETDNDKYNSYVTTSSLILNSPLKGLDSQIEVHSWSSVLAHLNDAASRIEVRSIHGGSGEALEYYNHKLGLSVIAVGGNKLSRGLTLEGLSVSYFLRASRMYDTLMQMGRWFGYRPGYVDLCRLFTSRELNEWYCHITQASEELREEFDYMSDTAGSTPEQYALKVRTHPGVLQISATNKMRTVVTVQISWAGRLVESYEFLKEKEVIENNFLNTQNFINTLPSSNKQKTNAFLWYDIPANQIISFFEGIQSVDNLKKAEPSKLIQYINSQLPNNELTHWRVALMNKPASGKRVPVLFAEEEEEIGCWVRSEDKEKSNEEIYFLIKSHIISPRDEFIDLSEEDYYLAQELSTGFRKKKESARKTDIPSGMIVREKIRDPKNPLLLLYFLDSEKSLIHYPISDNSIPFVGYAISFPKSNHNIPVSYAVHEQLLDRFDLVEEDIEDYGEAEN
jgi:hypothetical protein